MQSMNRKITLIENSFSEANNQLGIKVETFQYIDSFRVFSHFVMNKLVKSLQES